MLFFVCNAVYRMKIKWLATTLLIVSRVVIYAMTGLIQDALPPLVVLIDTFLGWHSLEIRHCTQLCIIISV